MQTTRNFVTATAKLATCADHGHDHINGFHRLSVSVLLRRVRAYWDTTAIVFDGHTTVIMNRDIDMGTKTGQSFINRVIHNFINKMMQSLDIRATHVHTWAFANVVNAFQSLNGTYIIIYGILFFFRSHKNLQSSPFSNGAINN